MNKKLFKDCLFLIVYSLVLVIVLLNLDMISGVVGTILAVLTPLFIGVIIALILNIPYMYTKRFILRRVFHKKAPRAAKMISLIFVYIVLILIIFLVIWFVIPELIASGQQLIANMETYYNNVTRLVSDIGERFHMTQEDISEYLSIFRNLFDNTSQVFTNILSGLVNVTSSIVGFVTNFFFGIIFSVYLLIDKKGLKTQMTNYVKAFSGKRSSRWILGTIRLSKSVFENYMLQRLTDVFISGFIFLIFSSIFGFNYPILISAIIGISCMIPGFGPFIGGFLSSILILVVDPGKFLLFILFFLILNQLERMFIISKIIKKKNNVPSLWVLVAVYVGGRIAGFGGMLFAVPVAAILYKLMKEIIFYYREKNYKNEDSDSNENLNIR
ncbi:MAG: AI-2E family transporter [Clostridiales bacterium]|nr:AI-2E family transporter [Clostridiales bacterium]